MYCGDKCFNVISYPPPQTLPLSALFLLSVYFHFWIFLLYFYFEYFYYLYVSISEYFYYICIFTINIFLFWIFLLSIYFYFFSVFIFEYFVTYVLFRRASPGPRWCAALPSFFVRGRSSNKNNLELLKATSLHRQNRRESGKKNWLVTQHPYPTGPLRWY